jgi:hypothetical protein
VNKKLPGAEALTAAGKRSTTYQATLRRPCARWNLCSRPSSVMPRFWDQEALRVLGSRPLTRTAPPFGEGMDGFVRWYECGMVNEQFDAFELNANDPLELQLALRKLMGQAQTAIARNFVALLGPEALH